MRQTILADGQGTILWASYVFPELDEREVVGSKVYDGFDEPLRSQIASAAATAFFTGELQRLAVPLTLPGRTVHMAVEYRRVQDLLAITWSYDPSSVQFTPRERHVFDQLCEGKTAAEVRAALKIATSTYETHRASVLRKTGSATTVHLVRWAIRHGYIMP